MRLRVREEAAFGLIELLIAITMLNVGILALVAAFNSGAVAITRAARVSNASVLAEKQMELFRGMKYRNMAQKDTEWAAALADSSWTADSEYTTHMQGQPDVADTDPASVTTGLVPRVSTCWAQSANACDPSFTTAGSDNHTYRVDTYMYYDTPTNGERIKVITVVVRDPSQSSRGLARITANFDIQSGSVPVS